MEEDLPNGKNKKNVKIIDKKDCEPLSKRQELNNHIVCMRNSVRQARVQLINRLISQIQKYKTRKGDPKGQEKAKRRADRILEEIQILKKIKKDKVSLFALQDTRQLDTILNNPESSEEERVLARLSHHNVIVREVKKYRDANPNWDKQIPVLLEMTREKRRKKKEKLNPEESPIPDRKHRIIISKTETEDSESDIDDANPDVVGKSDFDEVDDQTDDDLSEEEWGQGQQKIKKSIVTKSKFANKTNQNSNLGVKSATNSNKVVSLTPVVSQNKSEGTVKVKFLKNLNDLEDDVEQRTDKKFVNLAQAPQVKRPKSAFFVGGVDEPESDPEESPRKANFNHSPQFNQNQHNGHSKPVYKKGKLISKPPPGNSSQGNFRPNHKGQPPFRQGNADNRFGGNAEPLGIKKPRFSRDYQEEQLLKPPQKAEDSVPEKLHPSWEAKKKQQQISLTEFKGKKIVFNDDD